MIFYIILTIRIFPVFLLNTYFGVIKNRTF